VVGTLHRSFVLAGLRTQSPNRPRHIGDTRDAFDDAGYERVTSHVYRKTVATLMDEAGRSARQVADQLGQADITTTQRHYLGRTKITRDAARVLDAIQPRNHRSDRG
jgi:integrase